MSRPAQFATVLTSRQPPVITRYAAAPVSNMWCAPRLVFATQPDAISTEPAPATRNIDCAAAAAEVSRFCTPMHSSVAPLLTLMHPTGPSAQLRPMILLVPIAANTAACALPRATPPSTVFAVGACALLANPMPVGL